MLSTRNSPTTIRQPDPFDEAIVYAIKEHAQECYPDESCGLVTTDGYLPCENVHPNPNKAWMIHPGVTAEVLQRGAILAVVHSHPDGPNYPSFADQENQIDSELTWGIVPVIGITDEGDPAITKGHASEILWWGDNLPIQPLERRKFIWGIYHCWSLYRDWWRLEHGITLPNFACPPDFAEEGINIFLDNVVAAGLKDMGKLDMGDLKRGDMLLGHLRGNIPNHCGVYLGGDDFLHHAPDQASGRANLLRWWPHIDTVFRYDNNGSQKITPIRPTG